MMMMICKSLTIYLKSICKVLFIVFPEVLCRKKQIYINIYIIFYRKSLKDIYSCIYKCLGLKSHDYITLLQYKYITTVLLSDITRVERHFYAGVTFLSSAQCVHEMRQAVQALIPYLV